jgi:hypothetical protein
MVGGILLNKQAQEIADAQEEGIIDDRAAQNFLADVNWRLTRLRGARALEDLTLRSSAQDDATGATQGPDPSKCLPLCAYVRVYVGDTDLNKLS